MNEKGNIKKTIQFKKEYDELITKLYKGLDLERQDINNLIIGAGINQIVEIMEEYVIKQEKKKKKIYQINITLDDLYQVLKRKREELRQSKHPYDRIYVYFCIERLNIYKISNLMSYSESQIYRKLKKMGIDVKMQKNAKITMLK